MLVTGYMYKRTNLETMNRIFVFCLIIGTLSIFGCSNNKRILENENKKLQDEIYSLRQKVSHLEQEVTNYEQKTVRLEKSERFLQYLEKEAEFGFQNIYGRKFVFDGGYNNAIQEYRNAINYLKDNMCWECQKRLMMKNGIYQY
jgi:hypothetical protein